MDWAGCKGRCLRASLVPSNSKTAQAMVAKHPGLKLKLDKRLQERCLGSLEGSVWSPSHGIPDDAETRVQCVVAVSLLTPGSAAAYSTG